MNEKLYRETFSHIHASEDTITEVLKMARREKRKHKHTPLRAVLVAAVVMALVVTTVATVSTIRLAMQEQRDTQTVALDMMELGSDTPQGATDKYGNAVTLPEMQRGTVSEETVAKLLGDAMYTVDGTFSHDNGNTYTLDTFLIDEQGMGILTYTVSNPDGIGYQDGGYGEIWDGGVDLFLSNGASYEEGHICDWRALLVGEANETEIRVLEKFGTFDTYTGQGISVGREDTAFGHLLPEKHLATRIGTDSEGNTISVSPLGVSITCFKEDEPSLSVYTVELNFADGSTYTVISHTADYHLETMNHDIAYHGEKDGYETVNYVFANLVDINELTSIHVEGSYYPDGNGNNPKVEVIRDYMF